MTRRVKDSAAKAGIQACIPRMEQVTNFLDADGKGAAISFYPSSNADRHLASVSLGLEMEGSKAAYASESFAPNQTGCDALYETVVYWEGGCENVARTQFAAFKNYGLMADRIMVLDGGPKVRVFLMPAGAGCVAIKKEVLN